MTMVEIKNDEKYFGIQLKLYKNRVNRGLATIRVFYLISQTFRGLDLHFPRKMSHNLTKNLGNLLQMFLFGPLL